MEGTIQIEKSDTIQLMKNLYLGINQIVKKT